MINNKINSIKYILKVIYKNNLVKKDWFFLIKYLPFSIISYAQKDHCDRERSSYAQWISIQVIFVCVCEYPQDDMRFESDGKSLMK